MKHALQYFFLLLLCCVNRSFSKALYASAFNQSISCDHPLVLDESTTIFFDEDIILSDCLFAPTASFLPDDTLTFVSRKRCYCIISADFDWQSVLPQGQKLIIRGAGVLGILPGCAVRLDNSIELYDQAVIEWL